MAKIKLEKIAGIEKEIRRLENRRKQIVQGQKAQERKDRTKRLCRRILDELTAQNAATPAEKAATRRRRAARTGIRTRETCKGNGLMPYLCF